MCACILLMAVGMVQAQKIYVQGPANVLVGQQFQLEVVLINAEGQLTPPDFKLFEVLGNGREDNVGIENGQMVRSVKIFYYLVANKEGLYKLNKAKLTSKNGNTIESNALSINVTARPVAPPQPKQPASTVTNNLQQQIKKDVFMRLVLSKADVYKGEMLTATYRIYFRQEVSDVQLQKQLTFDGFWNQEVQLQPTRRPVPEKVNGIMYNTVDIMQYNLYPQHAGNLSVPGAKLKAVVIAPVETVRNFGGARVARQSIQEIAIQFDIPAEGIQVKELPMQGKPEGFSGLVGKYTCQAIVSSTETKTDEPITYTAIIKGSGNLKFIEQHAIAFNDVFEAYDPKVKDKITGSANGYSGSKQYDYLLIPRQPGEYTIAPPAFSYFEPTAAKYYTIKQPEFLIKVTGAPSANSNSNAPITQSDVPLLKQDIRYIKTDAGGLSKEGSGALTSMGYAAALASPFLIFIGLIAVRQRRQTLAADVVGTKHRNAIKLAKKRLAAAEQYLGKGDKAAFYNEVSRSIWGYLGDKLNIDMSGLSKDAVEEKLRAKNVGISTISKMKALLSTCEMALYAPLGNSAAMEQHYDAALNLIADLEDEIK